MISKRQFVCGTGALAAAAALGTPRGACAAETISDRLTEAFADIERRSGGRLGVSVFDSQNGMTAGHRSDERFPMCSTFKLLATAAVLQRIDAKKLDAEKRIHFE